MTSDKDDEYDKIKKVMEDLILVINRAELEVQSAMKELSDFIETINSK